MSTRHLYMGVPPQVGGGGELHYYLQSHLGPWKAVLCNVFVKDLHFVVFES